MATKRAFPAALAEELATTLQELLGMTGAVAFRLLCWPKGACCALGDEVLLKGSGVVVCGRLADCKRLRARAPRLFVVRPHEMGELAALLCATLRLSTGETLALQVGLPSIHRRSPASRQQVAWLMWPLLLWAKEALENRALAASLAELGGPSRAALLVALTAEEEERERLAYAVHDGVGEALVSAFQQLQAVQALAGPLPEVRLAAARGGLLLREAIRQARAIMNDLHPPLLDEVGLVALVEEELRGLEKEEGCQVQATLVYPQRSGPEVELALYRILHQALMNIRRHARARKVTVRLVSHPDRVELRVEDDGVGFDVARALAQPGHGGLVSMHRRAEMAGGVYRLESEPGKGTRLWVSIPKSRMGGDDPSAAGR